MLTYLNLSEYENDKQVGENFIDCSKGKTEQQIEKVKHICTFLHQILYLARVQKSQKLKFLFCHLVSLWYLIVIIVRY